MHIFSIDRSCYYSSHISNQVQNLQPFLRCYYLSHFEPNYAKFATFFEGDFCLKVNKRNDVHIFSIDRSCYYSSQISNQIMKFATFFEIFLLIRGTL